MANATGLTMHPSFQQQLGNNQQGETYTDYNHTFPGNNAVEAAWELLACQYLSCFNLVLCTNKLHTAAFAFLLLLALALTISRCTAAPPLATANTFQLYT